MSYPKTLTEDYGDVVECWIKIQNIVKYGSILFTGLFLYFINYIIPVVVVLPFTFFSATNRCPHYHYYISVIPMAAR